MLWRRKNVTNALDFDDRTEAFFSGPDNCQGNTIYKKKVYLVCGYYVKELKTQICAKGFFL